MDITGPVLSSPNNFSLTNYVELFILNSLCDTRQNQCQMLKYTPITIESAVSQYIHKGEYIPYLAQIKNNIKLVSVSYADLLKRKTTYFFVGADIVCTITNSKLLDKYNILFGAPMMSSVYVPILPNRFPSQMPSRGKVFR